MTRPRYSLPRRSPPGPQQPDETPFAVGDAVALRDAVADHGVVLRVIEPLPPDELSDSTIYEYEIEWQNHFAKKCSVCGCRTGPLEREAHARHHVGVEVNYVIAKRIGIYPHNEIQHLSAVDALANLARRLGFDGEDGFHAF